MFGVYLEAAEDLRQMKSRVLMLAIISAIIQHPKYIAILLRDAFPTASSAFVLHSI